MEEIWSLKWSNIVVTVNAGKDWGCGWVCVCVSERERMEKNLKQMKKYIYSNPELKFNMIWFDEVGNLRNESELR